MISPNHLRSTTVRVRALFALVALCLTIPLAGIDAQRPRIEFERMAQERGLSNGTVTAIVQDQVGFLWFGTEDGLDRYDGSGFTIFRPMPGDTSGLANAWVTGLAVGHDGTVWIGTLRGGVHGYDPRTRRFRRYHHRAGDSLSLSSDHVSAVHEAGGVLWVGTAHGLDRLDPATGHVRHYAPAIGDTTDLSNDVLAIAEDGHGRLWVGARMGLFVFDPASGRFERLGVVSREEPVHVILRDRRGVMWVGTEHDLVAVDPTGRLVLARHASATPGHPSPLIGRVLALFQGPDGTLWVGSDDGISALDPVTGAFTRYTYDPKDPRSLGGRIVRSAFVDRGGVLWVGVESYGLSKYAPAVVHFDLIRHDPSMPASLSNGYVRGITRDRRGDLWIGTQFGGLDRVDHRTARITVFRHRPGDPRSLPGDSVWAVLEDRGGALWVGLHLRGLGTLDPRTGAFVPSPLVPRDASVNVLYEDRAGALLVGLQEGGMLEISPDRRHVRSYGALTGEHRVLTSDDVQAILEDREGMLWVAGDPGLTRIDRRTGRVTHFRWTPGRPGSLGSDFITNVVEDHEGTIWIGTKGGGLERFDRATGRFTAFGTAEGLPHSFVYGILEDARGHLWLSTDDGIAMFDPRTHAVVRYGLEDGLQAREFNRRAFYRSPDGVMYFGGINGVNVFRPDDVGAPPPPPPVAIVSLRTAGGAARPLVGRPADSAVVLRHHESAFTVTFTALDFTAPEKTRYAYRLEGVDDGWISAGGRREASYASVPPGRYVFRVAAANAAGVWNMRGAAITLVIAKPWWATWWARLLASLLVIVLPFAVEHVRLRANRRRSAWLERRVEEQTRSLTDAQAQLRDALERERRAARELLEITAAVPGGVFQLREAPDGTRTFPFVSEGILRLYDAGASPGGGASEPPRHVAERLLASVHPDDAAVLERSLARSRDTLESWRTELRWATAADATRWLSVHAHPWRHADGTIVWTGVMLDATTARRTEEERAALEAKMLQAQKAESLGILAGGIAHDFNNLLVGVLGSADLLRDSVSPASEEEELLGHIRSSAIRAAELTQQMLAYAGKGRLVIERVDLVALVREMLALLRSVVPRTIAFELQASAVRPVVEADATQLRQVIMNLVTNAGEAIGDRGGRVAVRIGIESGAQRALALLHAAPDMPPHGPYALLEVDDDGCGMDAALLGRIFDPFYSTKFTGRGLGLAALLGIVRAHHGGLTVASAPGRGARFRIYLPLAASVEPREQGGQREATPDAAETIPAPIEHGCVLVVDDEEVVRLAAKRILRKLGYDVIVVADGAAALEVIDRRDEVDLVLMDVTMPVMDGPAAARALRARRA
ncbi:MAG TPA: two-component regulator propeller domain-containing protein, partial [Gemmatimonadaceae bacterium]|nr:two-component regulator propeller domain-containing protein [Gemmatimonadaceae bacterium]